MLAKYEHLKQAYARVRDGMQDPFNVQFEKLASPTQGTVNGKPVLLLGTNNYLGLTFDASCLGKATDALWAEGTGTTGSRVANGSYSSHRTLERQIAAFFGREAAML